MATTVPDAEPTDPDADERERILTSAAGTRDAKTIRLQDAVLVAYSRWGSINAACREVVEVDRHQVAWWIESDRFGFRARFADAGRIWAEHLQDIGYTRIEQQKPNDNPLLLITYLNAAWPERYRRDAVAPDDTALRVLQAFRELRRQEQTASLPALPSPTDSVGSEATSDG